jgi:hypothetical protein
MLLLNGGPHAPLDAVSSFEYKAETGGMIRLIKVAG